MAVFEIENLSRVPGYAWRYPTEISEWPLTIQRLLILTALFAISFAILRSSTCVGILVMSCVPMSFAMLCLNSWRTRSAFTIFVLAAIPIYLTSCGPVAAFCMLTFPQAIEESTWLRGAIEACYPLHSYIAYKTSHEWIIVSYIDGWVGFAEDG